MKVGRLLAARLARRAPVTVPISIRTFWGDRLYGRLPDAVSELLWRDEIYEPGLTAMLMSQIRPGQVFFDVGAHLGYFSVLAAHLGAAVHAFEPTPRTFQLLKRNAANRAIAPINAAAWAEPMTLHLADFGPRFSGHNSVASPRGHLRAVKTYEVAAVSLDHYAATHDAWPDVIKLDAEGAESRILDGMTEVLQRRPAISLEVGDDNGVSRALVERLITMGYRAFEYRDEQIAPHFPRVDYSYDNLLFTVAP